MPLSIEDQIKEDLELAEQLTSRIPNTNTNKTFHETLGVDLLPTERNKKVLQSSKQSTLELKKFDKKRKREEEQAWKKVIKRKLQEEEEKITVEEEKAFQSNRELYSLFNDLQGISQDFNISFETPELVVVGNQSDGKSSFVEGLLGFQFNIVASNIGTRRPLIIQMVNNPMMQNPSCRFRKEMLVGEGEDPFEEEETPIENISEEIEARTNKICGNGDTVSPVPIILRVEYSQCANLTIWDMPGFRHGGDKKLSQQILMLSERVMSQKNRIIICVEQSTTEWANSTSRPIVRKLDPEFSRTVLVNTKFDNRVKELRTKEEAHKYLSGEGLPSGKKPFFISLPVDRNLDGKEFKSYIRECYLNDFQSLLKTKFDEKYLSQIGFYKTKQFLEKLLSEKYHQSLRPTLSTLENICSKTAAEINRLEQEIKSNNLEVLKEKSIEYVQTFVQVIEKLLEGSIFGDPDKFGQTLIEERLDCCVPEWPNFSLKYDIINQDIKLYGGAQYQRLMNEFEYVAHSTEFPPTSINEVASSLGIGKSHTMPVFEIAASNIVKIKSRSTLLPLISIVLRRCSYILKRLLDIAIAVIQSEYHFSESPNEHFLIELGKIYSAFVEEVETKCKEKMLDDFDTFTKVIDWDLLSGFNEEPDYNYLKPSPEETRKRVVQLMDSNNEGLFDGAKVKAVNNNMYDQVRILSARLFSRIRFFFTKLIKNKFNAFFLDPIFEKLGIYVTNHFRRLSDAQYENIFQLGVVTKAEKLKMLKVQLAKCERERNRFKELFLKVRQDLIEKE